LVKKRRRRRQWQHAGVVPAVTTQPNDLWTADFKGHFRTRDATYCYPLTVADQHTRYLLACHGLLSTKGHGIRPIFDRLFREYGLPHAIRTDNGVPFATTGIHGLSRLNVWWLGCGSASNTSGSCPRTRSRTALTSGCTRLSRAKPVGRRSPAS
jgi:putative transposase